MSTLLDCSPVMQPGDRIVVTGGPWPERVGHHGTIVGNPHGYPVYPWAGVAKHEVVVLLPDDPLGEPNPSRTWSCVMRRRDVTVVG